MPAAATLTRASRPNVAAAVLARFVGEFDVLRDLYADYKRQAALLDFDDLLHHARDLLVRDPGVRKALARRYPRVLVDEFQDTDPLQAEILWLLCGDEAPNEPWTARRLRPGSLFLVQCSAMHLTNEMPYFRVWTRMRDFKAARIDHILDSSIYTLLGVAAGGIMTACLALALLRRDPDPEC